AYALGPVSVFGFLEGATAIAPGQEDPLDVRVGAEFGLLPALKLTGAVTRGLSKGSAAWGVSAGHALRFGRRQAQYNHRGAMCRGSHSARSGNTNSSATSPTITT